MTFFPTPVIAGVDGTRVGRHALLTAVEICGATGSGLHLVHIKLTSGMIRGRPMTPAQRERADAEGREFLETERRAAAEAGLDSVQTHLRYAENIEHDLVKVQHELVAGLLIIGDNPGGTLAQRLFRIGSGESAVRRSTASVMVIRPPSPRFGGSDSRPEPPR